MTNIFYFNWAI